MAKRFDYDAARDAGYSDDEISSFLSESHKNFDVLGALESGHSLKDISGHLNETKKVSKPRSAASALAKGVIKGGRRFSMMPNLGPISDEMAENLLNQFLPSEEGGLEDVLEFAGENAPLVAMGPGGILSKGGQAIAGAVAKKGAKELGLPEPVQDVLSGIGMSVPSSLKASVSKTLKPSAAQKDIVDFLRSKGMTDKQITPIIQNPKKLSALSKVASKFHEKDSFLKEMSSGLGEIYEDIFSRGSHKDLTGNGLNKFFDELQATKAKLPPAYRDALKKEEEYLMSEPITYKSLAEFKDGINAAIESTGRKSRKKVIGKLYDPVNQAMAHLDPALFKEERQLDKAYSKMKDFTRKMSKKDQESWFKLEKVAPAATAMLALNFAGLGKLSTGAIVAPAIAKQILTNPRLQRMHSKMWDEFRKGNMKSVKKLSETIEKQLEKQGDSKEDFEY